MFSISAKFKTSDDSIAIPDTIYELKSSYGPDELFSIINTVLDERHTDNPLLGNKLHFLVNSKLLRTSLIVHFEEEEQLVDSEKIFEIEYSISQKAPKPISSCSSDDWISCVHVNQTLVINGCYDGLINIWSLKEGQHLVGIPAHSGAIKDVQWIPNEKIKSCIADFSDEDYFFVSSSYDETSCIWRWNPSKDLIQKIFVCMGHSRSVDCVDVQDDLLATGSYDKMLKIWSLNDKSSGDSTKNQGNRVNIHTNSEQNPKRIKQSDGDRQNSTTEKMDTEENEKKMVCQVKTPLMTLSEHSEAITDLRWINSKNYAPITVATCSMDNKIKFWDIELGKVTQTLSGSKAFLSIDHSTSNSCLISGSCDRHVRLWDPRSHEGSMVKAVFTSHKGWVTCVKWSPKNHHFFVTGSYDGIVKHWDTRSTRSPLYDLLGHKDKVLAVDWSNPNYIASGSADKKMKLYDYSDRT